MKRLALAALLIAGCNKTPADSTPGAAQAPSAAAPTPAGSPSAPAATAGPGPSASGEPVGAAPAGPTAEPGGAQPSAAGAAEPGGAEPVAAGGAEPGGAAPAAAGAAERGPDAAARAAEGARARLLARVADTPPILAIRDSIRGVAKAQADVGASPSDITRSSAWPQLVRAIEPQLAAYRSGSADTQGGLEEVAAAAAGLVNDDDVHVRHAAYRTLELVLHATTRGEAAGGAAALAEVGGPYRDVLVERYAVADPKEQAALASAVSAGSGPGTVAFLEWVAETGKTDGVRNAALQALDACQDGRCALDGSKVETWCTTWEDSSARGAAFALAGKLKLPQTLEWCATRLDDAAVGDGCRSGLVRLGGEAAFKALDTWLEQLETTGRAEVPEYGSWVGLLAPFAAEDFAKARWPEVLTRALVNPKRHTTAATTLARMVPWLSDRAVAKRLLKQARSVWEGELAKRSAEESVRVGAVLEAIEDAEKLVARPVGSGVAPGAESVDPR